jgi:hypothetical protein
MSHFVSKLYHLKHAVTSGMRIFPQNKYEYTFNTVNSLAVSPCLNENKYRICLQAGGTGTLVCGG